MTTIKNQSLFLGTNVLIHANVAGSSLHLAAQKVITDYDQAGIDLWISRQVLREYLAALTRPQVYSKPIRIATLADDIVRFQRNFQVAEDSSSVTEGLVVLMKRFRIGGKQVHDANIVATMQHYGITQLLTHNITHFDRFSKIISIVPL